MLTTKQELQQYIREAIARLSCLEDDTQKWIELATEELNDLRGQIDNLNTEVRPTNYYATTEEERAAERAALSPEDRAKLDALPYQDADGVWHNLNLG